MNAHVFVTTLQEDQEGKDPSVSITRSGARNVRNFHLFQIVACSSNFICSLEKQREGREEVQVVQAARDIPKTLTPTTS